MHQETSKFVLCNMKEKTQKGSFLYSKILRYTLHQKFRADEIEEIFCGEQTTWTGILNTDICNEKYRDKKEIHAVIFRAGDKS